MTDNEIIEGFKKLINRQKAKIESLTSQCSAKDVIINSQEAEIERLNGILDKRCDVCPAVNTAIKEFWDKLKSASTQGFWDSTSYVTVEDGDDLVKELTEQRKEGKGE